MEIFKKSNLTESDSSSIYRIWNSVYPSQAAFSNRSGFEEYLSKAGDPIHYCVFIDNILVGWLMAFNRDEERWFTILVSQNSQGLGIGRELLKMLKEDEVEVNGWILEDECYETLSGDSYRSPTAFYIRNGFKITCENQESRGMKFTKIYWALEKV